jgi:hypothetical protein
MLGCPPLREPLGFPPTPAEAWSIHRPITGQSLSLVNEDVVGTAT